MFRYYGAAGIFLWLFDRCVRLVKRSRVATNVEIVYHHDCEVVSMLVALPAI